MIALTILLIVTLVISELKERTFVRWVIPVVAGVMTLNPLLGALVLVGFFLIYDPVRNYSNGFGVFHSRKKTFKEFIKENWGLYEVFDGRIVLMIEAFIFIVLLFES